MILFPIQRRDNKKNEMFVHQVHVELLEISPRDSHKLSLEKQNAKLIIQSLSLLYRQ